MNLATLNDLFSNFSSHALKSFTKNRLAHANESYIVTADNDHKYVIKILMTQGVESARVEALIQHRACRAGIVTPCYLPLKNGHVVGEAHGVNFTVSEYIIGGRDATISPQLFLSIGNVMAKIHQSLDGVIIPLNDAQWLAQTNVQRDFQGYSGTLKAELASALDKNPSFSADGLPASVIHGDLTLNNIFTNKDSVVAVFDFETAENAPRTLDIARTFLSLRRQVEYPAEVILAKLLKGYDAATDRSLTRMELERLNDAIKYVAVACAVWCASHKQEDGTKEYLRLSEEADEIVNNTIMPG